MHCRISGPIIVSELRSSTSNNVCPTILVYSLLFPLPKIIDGTNGLPFRLFERGADSVGLDFLAHPFWDKYLEFEERAESQDNIFTILGRIVHIPMHQYARYFERYRAMAANRPVTELVSEDLIAQFRQEIVREGGQKQKTDRDIQQEVRARVDNHLMESFQRTQNETTKRWTYESEIKRPYYHVTELDEPQLANWRKYLDFEEMEGDYTRTKFLYERCLVTAANYDEFWLRYARWMLAQEGKQEEVRNIYQRASCIYVPISGPTIRLFYARFEEAEGRPDVGVAIHEAILMNLPGHVETIISLANVHRRQYGLDSAIKVLKKYIDSPVTSPSNTGAFVSEWARMIWKIKGDADAAREIYQSNQHSYPDSRAFWVNWLGFEMQQPTSVNDEATCYKRVKLVYDSIRKNAKLAPALIQEMSGMYFTYLNERGGKDSMKELMALDSDINGPPSVALKEKFLEDGKGGVVENGHLNATANESAVQAGGNAYSKYYSQAGEQPVNGNQPAPIRHVA